MCLREISELEAEIGYMFGMFRKLANEFTAGV